MTTPSEATNTALPRWQTPKWRAFTAIAVTYITIVFATAFSFLALPAIAEDFDVTLRAVGWIVIIESLLVAALLLPLGGLADAIGDKRVLRIGIAIFGAGTLFAGLAPTFVTLIIARVIMALGNALVQSVGTGMVVAVFPANERGLAMGAQTSAVAIGSAGAPLLGGLGLAVLSWNTMFLLLLIPTALSFLAAHTLVPDHQLREIDPDRRFDIGGSVLSALAVAVLVVTINNPFSLDWLSPGILVGAATAVGLLAAFIRWELRTEHPMLELRLFAVSVYRTAVSLRILGFLASTVTNLLLPVYLLSFRQAGAATAGVILAGAAVGMFIAAQISGRMYDRFGPRAPTLIGLGLQVAVSLVFAFSTDTTSLFVIGVGTALSGFAMGMWNVPNNGAMLGATPPQFLGVGGAFTNVTRTLGNVLGQAMAATVVAGVMVAQGFDIPLGELDENPAAGVAFNEGWRVAYLIAAGLTVALIALATRLPGRAESNGQS